MARPWRELEAKMRPERVARAKAKARAMLEQGVPLDHLRGLCEVTQEQMAAALGVRQASVSKLEWRTDLQVSTLRRYVEALGAQLEIRAVFPGDEDGVRLGRFGQSID